MSYISKFTVVSTYSGNNGAGATYYEIYAPDKINKDAGKDSFNFILKKHLF